MSSAAAPSRPTGRRSLLFLVGLTVVAVALVFAFPQIAARFAERRVAAEATEVGEGLVEGYTRTGTFPRTVVADNADGNHPEVLADRRPLPGVMLASGMAIYYYSSDAKSFIGFCVEHRPHNSQPNAFAVYGAHVKEKEGDLSQTGHGNGCLSAE